MSSPNKNECAVCKKSPVRLICSRCKTIYYCGRDHQSEDWKQHKALCKAISKARKEAETNIDTVKLDAKDLSTEDDELVRLKREFDRVRLQYNLASEENAGKIADLLTSGNQINVKSFAEEFNMPISDALHFIAWIEKGVNFKQTAIDPHYQGKQNPFAK